MVTGIAIENLENVARVLGERWARRRWADRSTPQNAELWPGSLEQARDLLDELIGTRLRIEQREALALMVERSARATWTAIARSANSNR
jgi:hypothetical protein